MMTVIDPSEFSCVRYYAAGQTIFKEGERGNTALVVCEGAIEIFKGNGDREVRVALCDAGSIFGEMALVDDSPRSASARAQTHATCLVLPKDRFRRFFDEADPFVRGLLCILVANVRETTDSMALFHRALADLRSEPAPKIESPQSPL
jgi:CRP/FNR family transcriptional regulator, cyclic AMP receptor protein